jgi:hypothetical protein
MYGESSGENESVMGLREKEFNEERSTFVWRGELFSEPAGHHVEVEELFKSGRAIFHLRFRLMTSFAMHPKMPPFCGTCAQRFENWA